MAGEQPQTLSQVNADWAWRTYEPKELTPREVSHFFRRGGFGAHPDEKANASGLSATELAEKHLPPYPADDDFAREMQSFAKLVAAGGNVKSLTAWWLHRMLHSPRPLAERTTLFWHGHFATGADKVDDIVSMLNQHNTIRKHAWGKFELLVQAISRDPAMLLYLDSATNSKTHPNENYAREVMELFCLGVGNYTEHDIQQVARCFTGWQITRGKFRFNPYQHDNDTKSFLGQSGNFDGDDAVRIIIAQPAAARFICHKLCRFFIADGDLPPAVIESLAEQLRKSDFTIEPVINTILTSNLFYSDLAIGGKIRSPIEVGIGLMRSLGARNNMNLLADRMEDLGERPFYPPNVKGWEGGRNWINSQTLLGRANLVRFILRNNETKFTEGSFDHFAAKYLAGDAAATVEKLTALLLAVQPPASAKEQLQQVVANAPNSAEGAKRAIEAMSLLPEFHLN